MSSSSRTMAIIGLVLNVILLLLWGISYLFGGIGILTAMMDPANQRR